MRATGPDETTRTTVYVRALGRCERCGDADGPFAIHHRRPRAMGGTRREDTNSPSNLVLLDDGCHRQVESWRQEALRDGWVVRQNIDPALAPVDVYGRGLVYLTGTGTYVSVTDGAA